MLEKIFFNFKKFKNFKLSIGLKVVIPLKADVTTVNGNILTK